MFTSPPDVYKRQGNQVANRGLAAARWSYNSRSAALGDGKADILQNRNFIVGECHITKSNVCALQRNISVSYTHLDVYKRQERGQRGQTDSTAGVQR